MQFDEKLISPPSNASYVKSDAESSSSEDKFQASLIKLTPKKSHQDQEHEKPKDKKKLKKVKSVIFGGVHIAGEEDLPTIQEKGKFNPGSNKDLGGSILRKSSYSNNQKYRSSNPQGYLLHKDSFGSHMNSIGRKSEQNQVNHRFKSKIPESFYNASLKTILTDGSSTRSSGGEIVTRKEDLKSPFMMKILAILGASGGMYLGYFTVIFNVLNKPILQEVYGIKDGDDYINSKGNLALIFSVGAIFGCILSGYLGDLVGRMKTLVVGLAIEIVTYSFYSVEGYYFLLVTR